eukprot:scaffold2.g6943.t1
MRRDEGEEELSDFIRVTGKEEARHYAPKIAWNARNSTHMPLLCTGAAAINTAIKAGCDDHLDIKVIPSFEEVSKERADGLNATMTALRLQVVPEEV